MSRPRRGREIVRFIAAVRQLLATSAHAIRTGLRRVPAVAERIARAQRRTVSWHNARSARRHGRLLGNGAGDGTPDESLIVDFDGNRYVASVRTSATSAGLRRANLDLVIDACRSAGLAVRPGPGTATRTELAVEAPDARPIIGALRQEAPHLWIETNERWPLPVSHRAHDLARRNVEPVLRLLAFQPICAPDSSGLMAEEYGVEINVVDHLGGPSSTPSPRSEMPLFPIDIVYTWVDGRDPRWRRSFDQHRSPSAIDGHGDHRFRSVDELRFSLRSVAQHVPWCRSIFLVTDRQTPSWLRGDARIEVVDHRDIFTNPEVLPVFNSHAIESQLHRIPGLAEHYVYMNDDVFFGRLSWWTDFFDPNGTALFAESDALIPLAHRPTDAMVDFSGRNGLRLLERSFGTVRSNKIQHTPHAQLKSIHHQIERDFPGLHEEVARSRFRSGSDVSMAAYLHHRYGEAIGLARVTTDLDYDYVDTARRDLAAVLEREQQRRTAVWCLNDSIDRPDDADETVTHALERLYPYIAPWERPTGPSMP